MRGAGRGLLRVRFLLTVWLTPHMRMLRRGSEARKSLTFWQTKCFFFVLVLEALSVVPRAAVTLPGTVPPVQLEAMAARGPEVDSPPGKAWASCLPAGLWHGSYPPWPVGASASPQPPPPTGTGKRLGRACPPALRAPPRPQWGHPCLCPPPAERRRGQSLWGPQWPRMGSPSPATRGALPNGLTPGPSPTLTTGPPCLDSIGRPWRGPSLCPAAFPAGAAPACLPRSPMAGSPAPPPPAASGAVPLAWPSPLSPPPRWFVPPPDQAQLSSCAETAPRWRRPEEGGVEQREVPSLRGGEGSGEPGSCGNGRRQRWPRRESSGGPAGRRRTEPTAGRQRPSPRAPSAPSGWFAPYEGVT